MLPIKISDNILKALRSDVKLEVGECGICILGEESEIQNAVNNYLLSESKEEMFSDFTHKLGNFFQLHFEDK